MGDTKCPCVCTCVCRRTELPRSVRSEKVRERQGMSHTPSVAFRYLPPNSARIGYATEGALFISVRSFCFCLMSSDANLRAAVHLQRSAPSERFGSSTAPKHARKPETRLPRVKKREFRIDSNDFGFIRAGVSNLVSYKRNV